MKAGRESRKGHPRVPLPDKFWKAFALPGHDQGLADVEAALIDLVPALQVVHADVHALGNLPEVVVGTHRVGSSAGLASARAGTGLGGDLDAVAGAQGTDGGDGDEPRTFTQADNQLLEDDVFARIDAVTAPSDGGRSAKRIHIQPHHLIPSFDKDAKNPANTE